MTTINKMLDPVSCEVFLKRQQERIQAPNKRVAASMVLKRYAQQYPKQVLDAMLEGNVIPIISMEACSLSDELKLMVDASQVQYTSSRADGFAHLFSQHLRPLVLALHQNTRLPLPILWENVAVRFNSYFRKAVENDPESLHSITRLAACLHELDGSYFDEQENPLVHYLVPVSDLTQSMTRRTCCFYYQLEKEKEMSHCLVCPLRK